MLAKNKMVIVATLLMILMVACAAIVENNFPEIDIPMAEMNKAFVIEEPPVMANSHKNNELLALQLRNKSDTGIIIPNDDGSKIFRKDGQSWIPVENNIGYPSGEETLLTSKEFPPGLIPVLIPYIPGMKQPEIIRVVFNGHNDNLEAKSVGAYIELTLLP
jgi:hypothetical protein